MGIQVTVFKADGMESLARVQPCTKTAHIWLGEPAVALQSS